MDLLQTAVVDITTLVATCHACRSGSDTGEQVLKRRLRQRLRTEIKRATLAYIDTLARSRRGGVDDELLRHCRLAAEQQMPHALAQQALLARIMNSEAGALDGLAAARQDLWRLSTVAIHLASGMAAWPALGPGNDARPADASAARLRRRLRKALIDYARTALRTKEPTGRSIAKARQAALAQIGRRGSTDAEWLADAEAGSGTVLHLIRQGVSKPLMDLRLDWQGPGEP